jgi:O-antigen ligase
MILASMQSLAVAAETPSADITSCAQRTGRRGAFGLPHMRLSDWVTVWIGGLLPIGYLPTLMMPSTSLRYALVVAAIPMGALAIAKLIGAGDRPSFFAVAFLLAATVSGMFGPTPQLSIRGHLGSHSSVLLFAGYLALWAMARVLTTPGVSLLTVAVMSTSALNVLVGVAQLVFQVRGGPLGTFDGRASGLLANAAFYGSAITGLSCVAIVRCARRGGPWTAAIAVFFTLGATISGSRSVVIPIIAAVVAAAVMFKRQALMSALAAAAGLVGGLMLIDLTAGSTAVERLTSDSDDGRAVVWGYGLKALVERPIFGWGLGGFGSAVRPFFSAEFTRQSAWDDYAQSWEDPHNVVVMLLVSTGFVGVLLALGFLLTQLRRGLDAALVAGFLGTAFTWLLQPASVHSFAIAMLFLGAAAPRLAWSSDSVSDRRVNLAMLTVAGVLLTCLVLPNAVERHALRSGTPQQSAAVAGWLLDDPVIDDAIAWKFAYAAQRDPSLRDAAIERSIKVVRIAPNRPYYWAEHARRLTVLGEYDAVPAALTQAFRLERWNPSAWEAQLSYAVAVRDYELADQTRAVVCRLDLALCVTGSRAPTFDDTGSG